MLIIKTSETDIFRNLAIEECIFESEAVIPPALFLWQSDSAVVLGKHQNPWKECLVDELKQNSIPLARRISGGGTVFHDIGNLNYTVILDQKDYDVAKIYEMIFNALKTFGLEGKVENKSNLCIDGKKFSGNAFAFRKKRAMHHGTLLINADLDKLRHFLKPQYENIETKAIASIPASVVNLHALTPEITVNTLSEALKASFTDMFAGDTTTIRWNNDDLDKWKIDKIAEHLQSDDWILGKTPAFTITLNGIKHQDRHGRLPF